ncbi:serine protease [Coprothermobacteraceae bacterium]|nr:serine protease [Coprothermobacteraceae bacterium]
MVLKQRKIRLALGSGGYLGFAHIGVLKALEDAGIGVERISGSSIGSVVAVLHARGLKAAEIEEIGMSHLDQIFSYRSLQTLVAYNITEANMVKFVRSILGVEKFDQLEIPTYICATDLVSLRTVWFSSGSLVDAVRASVAVPGFFPPLVTKGMVLADGGILQPLPVDVFRVSAVPVVAVNLYAYLNRIDWRLPKSLVRKPLASLLRTTDAMLWAVSQRQKEFWFTTVEPDLVGADDEETPMQERAIMMIKRGEEAMKRVLPELERML